MSDFLPTKYRSRMDRLAPSIAFRALSKIGKKRLPGIIQRLYDLAEDQNPRIALDAIEKIMKFSGVAAFVEAGIRVAAEQASEPDDGDEQEDDRATRRKALARKYRASAAPPSAE